MKINGYKINYSEEQLQDMLSKSVEIKLIDKEFSGYKKLSEGNKRLLNILLLLPK